MKLRERFNLLAPCGIDCGICELYLCRDNPQLLDALISKGMPADKLPCLKLHPAADGASILPHNFNIYNLCQFQNLGPEEFIERAKENEKRYYEGKMKVGKGAELT
jgi:hypothetical protein